MSKIYEALGKADKERKEGIPPLLDPEDVNEQGIPSSWNGGNLEGLSSPNMALDSEGVSRGLAAQPDSAKYIGFDPRLVAVTEPGSVAAEQFRKLRTSIHRRNIMNPFRTVLVTSSENSEGKSFVAANLGVTLALDLHAQCLLVDCDLRNPTLSQWFGLQNDKGLSDYLKGNGEYRDYIRETGFGKLKILTAGGIQKNPTELLSSNRMKDLVRELGSQDNNLYVIFDSTPILATSEPEVLAKLVDGIIYVVRAGTTPRETVQRAISSLEKEKILGVALNDLSFKSGALGSRYFGSGGSYYYRNGYGYGRKPSNFAEPQKGLFNKLFHRDGNSLK
jgi:protein-tyrosine kinase